MGEFQNFAKILEKKIRQEIEKEFLAEEETASFQSEIPSETWTRLVGQMGTFQFKSPQKGQAYHRFQKPPQPRPDHEMNSEQKEALAFFQMNQSPLKANFSQVELTKCFRQLALKLHPDQGGSSGNFQKLLRARAVLQTVFK